MRAVFGALTTRGRAFVSSGLTAVLCAIVLGLDDLIRVGVLLVTLPLISGALVVHGRQQLGLSRTVTPTRITAGGTAEVELALSNEGRSPTGLLLLEEEVPPALGSRPRFVVDRMGTRWRRTVAYGVSSELRGRYQLGPMRVRVDDPLGLVELDRTFHSTTDLVVTPRVVPLPAVPLGGAWTGSGDNRPKDFLGGSPEDVTVREYRRGDDLRRVHWRSSAHAGDLMVRREEQPWQSRATLFVDNRAPAHRGAGLQASLEYAVSAAASIAVHLSGRGYRVRLVTAGEGDGDHAWHDVGTVRTEAGTLLESLAVLRTAPRVDIDASWLGDAHQGGLLVAVLGDTFPADHAVLRRMQHGAGTAMAMALDVRRWAGRPADPARPLPSVALLTSLGWRAVAAGPDDPIDAAWQRLGLTVRRGRDLSSRTLTAPGGSR
jgi:uncharacterized protein (DUF58 family)